MNWRAEDSMKPVAHLDPYTVDTRGSFTGINLPTNHSSPYFPKAKNWWSYVVTPPYVFIAT
jgi:hypothetical protein